MNLSKKIMLNKLSIFTTAFVQVCFVVVNTYFVSKGSYIGVLIASFMISLIWSFNVKKVAFGDNCDRVIYASGAAIGAVVGLLTSSFIMSLFNQYF